MGQAYPTRIFVGQVRGGPMRDRLARFATPTSSLKVIVIKTTFRKTLSTFETTQY